MDLEEYYYAGYGNEANRHIGCPPVRDLLQRLERTINGKYLKLRRALIKYCLKTLSNAARK